MIPQLKSEIRKLFSVRSTYVLILIGFVMISLFSYFGTSVITSEKAVCKQTGEVLYSNEYEDPRLQGAGPEQICGGEVEYVTETSSELPKDKLLLGLQESVPVITTFVSIVIVLFMAYEFRYNTINHTLTISNSRSKVLVSKLLVSVVFTVLVTLLAIGLNVLVTKFAIDVKNLTLPGQDYNWLYVVSRHVGYAVASSVCFLGVITIVHSLTAGTAAIFVLPIINSIAAMLLAARNIEPTRILFFTALERFGSVAADVTGQEIPSEFLKGTSAGPASVVGAGAIVAVYLIALWVITWIIFLRRDAN